MQFRFRQKRKLFLNVASLIDVVFLLLIFFMVSSTFREQPGLKLELPEAKSSEISELKEYTLYIGTDLKMFLNEEPVTFENLGEALEAALADMQDRALTLKADKEVPHGTVVRVMDIARQSGVKKLIIGTEVARPEP
jgi:biopolymer transport protein ExbD